MAAHEPGVNHRIDACIHPPLGVLRDPDRLPNRPECSPPPNGLARFERKAEGMLRQFEAEVLKCLSSSPGTGAEHRSTPVRGQGIYVFRPRAPV